MTKTESARVRGHAAWALAALVAMGACGTTTGIKSGETHFLVYCADTCPEGLSCRCGVCTEVCESSASCQEISEGSSCVSPDSAACATSESICDLGCTEDADCSGLGPDHVCTNGACRAGTPTPPKPESVECPAECTLLSGFPEDPANRCLALDAVVEGQNAPGVPVACTCDSPSLDMSCFKRVSDETLWVLPVPANVEFLDASAWVACSAAEAERVTTSCDFSHCPEGSRPPTTCDFESTCSILGCGETTQYDAQGCVRPSCEDDADCAAGEYCSNLSRIGLQAFIGGDLTSCGYGGDGGVVPGRYCRSLVPPGPLCDGSNDVRLIANTSGGYSSIETLFTHPWGYDFLIVNGQCQYWVAGDNGQVLTGILTADEGTELELDVGWNMLPEWSAFDDQETCADAGVVGLLSLAGSARCSCGCDADAPLGLDAAMDAALNRSLAGTPLEELLRVVAVPIVPGEEPAGAFSLWPLTRDIADFVIEPNSFQRDSGSVVDGEEAELLRGLRATANLDTGFPRLLIETGDGTRYQVLARDELPSEVETFFQKVSGS